MRAADAARGEHLDASHVGNDHGGRDSGRTQGFACNDKWQITAADFSDGMTCFAELFDFIDG